MSTTNDDVHVEIAQILHGRFVEVRVRPPRVPNTIELELGMGHGAITNLDFFTFEYFAHETSAIHDLT
jgi:hypothetical protein